jgi:hypothetical protein
MASDAVDAVRSAIAQFRTEYVVFNNKKYTIHSKKYQRPTPIK